ncbi:MAG TPA: hypothetical protein VGL03_02120 [Thermoanaerobaculia bacterium]|jgi:hypothetical protein
MTRFVRLLLLLAVVLVALGVRAVGCRKKEVPGALKRPTPKIFSDFTPPPPRATLTMPPGVTRVPTLPE